MSNEEETKGEVIPYPGTPVEKRELGNELETDIENAKKNMRHIAEIGLEAVKEAAEFAFQSQQDRMYTALSSLMKSTMEANRELIDTHRKKQEMEQMDPDGPSHVTNQIVFQGTTNDMLDKFLKKRDDKKDEDV